MAHPKLTGVPFSDIKDGEVAGSFNFIGSGVGCPSGMAHPKLTGVPSLSSLAGSGVGCPSGMA
eukprot:CAMPEP_0202450626 /NCGR_PEP_ID=MMETSP1360-20130828/9218_1 /ASSEMBLY_ACC=CAM_ASM_000848 /TAXON_ID=515479 /ORGANISM="Licmophora paradoxa, Strain CCMP2313" /LENGTH=62 /DNA_ID=CAMNT_0049068971 /DNA_START=17 /DNA_END=201 /DNA_ORIENTATION=+